MFCKVDLDTPPPLSMYKNSTTLHSPYKVCHVINTLTAYAVLSLICLIARCMNIAYIQVFICPKNIEWHNLIQFQGSVCVRYLLWKVGGGLEVGLSVVWEGAVVTEVCLQRESCQ